MTMRASQLSFVAMLIAGLVSGCGDPESKKQEVVPVRGRVVYLSKGETKPLVGAEVVFNPVKQTSQTNPIYPQAVTDERGEFVLGTYEKNDGAPKGDYVVTVVWRGNKQKDKKKFMGGSDESFAGKNRLPAQYGNPKGSPFRQTVSGGNEPIVLTIKPGS